MVGYRRMGNMGQQDMGNTTSAESLLPRLGDTWKSPRGTVHQIEALALVAIFLSFFLAVFESCRRWTNNWWLQKGFLVANALFLSLGTYSIGLMQSSQVKSDMYPIWAVSLLALLCCIDSAAASGLDNRSQLWKMLYQLGVYFGYVMVMSITTISSDIGNIAICVLAAVTFIKGFHRSMALVLPSSMRNMIREIPANKIIKCSFGDADDEEKQLIVDDQLDIMVGDRPVVDMGDINGSDHDGACKDVCLSFSLSHLLHRRFLGLRSIEQISMASTLQPLVRNYERAFKVVEIELAFLYDILYTSNTFLHYYEAKSASIWGFASVVGICFVGSVAIIPGTRTTRHASHAGTVFVKTTTADYVITGVILVSLALLQLFQLLRCWTSNWARVAFACDSARNKTVRRSCGMILKAHLLKFHLFEEYFLWQNKLGQHSVLGNSIRDDRETCCLRYCCRLLFCCKFLCRICACICSCNTLETFCLYAKRCLCLLGLQYVSRELKEMFRGCCGRTGSLSPLDLKLYPDVKTSIGDFIRDRIRSDEVSDWPLSFDVENRHGDLLPQFPSDVYVSPSNAAAAAEANEMIYVSCILTWHIATCYCELHEQVEDIVDNNNNKECRVATALSKYCAYLVASAPRLLPGRSETTKSVYAQLVKEVASRARYVKRWSFTPAVHLQAMNECHTGDIKINGPGDFGECIYKLGVKLGNGLINGRMAPADRWKLLAEFWVKALVYAAPSDKVEEHMQHLSQGGELITHLWAMLYHAGIQEWKLSPPQPQSHLRVRWDYMFQIQSWRPHQPDLQKGSQPPKNVGNILREGRAVGKHVFKTTRRKLRKLLGKRYTKSEGDVSDSEVRTDASRDARLDGASSSCPPPSPDHEAPTLGPSSV